MNIHVDKTENNKSHAVANAVSQKQNGGESSFQFADNRPEAIAQRKLQEMANNTQKAKETTQLQSMADNFGQINNSIVQLSQPGSKGDQKSRGVARANHSYTATYKNGTTSTFQAGSHAAAQGIATRNTPPGTSLTNVVQNS